jgi:hypothetical protein
MSSDEVDRIVEDWSRERPDIDFAPLWSALPTMHAVA